MRLKTKILAFRPRLALQYADGHRSGCSKIAIPEGQEERDKVKRWKFGGLKCLRVLSMIKDDDVIFQI